MSRIYLVKTPAGERLVEAGTKGQAINHCVSTDYSADPISASDLHAYLQQGANVEKVVTKEKKPAAGATSGQTASTTPAASTAPLPASPALPPAAAASGNPVPAAPAINQAAPAPLAGLGQTAPTPASPSSPAGGWNPPQPSNGVNAILAEQQRINPEAAAAAGVPPQAPAAILPIAPRPAAQAPAPAGWQSRDERGELIGGGVQRRND